MKRRHVLVLLASGVFFAGPALAQDFVDSVIAQLVSQDYTDITQSRTFLGRIRIIALRGKDQREIVLNPRTGEILRDLVTLIDGGSVDPQILKESGKTDGHESSGDDDDDDDDDDGR